jgi:hypothetical protein
MKLIVSATISKVQNYKCLFKHALAGIFDFLSAALISFHTD